jgi:hypothetical protein
MTWYSSTRTQFLREDGEQIAAVLSRKAAQESLEVPPQQVEEWQRSVGLLQENLAERIPQLQQALRHPAGVEFQHVILEFDFRRRGLRIDVVLLGAGVMCILEFKRNRLGAADHDQVMGYAVNLLEFHEETRRWCDDASAIVVPILVRSAGRETTVPEWPGLATGSWNALARRPLKADATSLGNALAVAVENRRTSAKIDATTWLTSAFRPSSSMIDAALSLYGNHDVAVIKEHEAPQKAIEESTAEIRNHIHDALAEARNHVVFLSGAPGAGKTLVGLELALRGEHARDCVFVTGNAPLVDVINAALKNSYQSQSGVRSLASTGFARSDRQLTAAAATFKVVKAHHFLGPRGIAHNQQDGRVLVFDEAQRTYEKGRKVLNDTLEEHEAELILLAQERSFPALGTVVVALVGHNQVINRGERGIVAWLEAAEKLGWTFSIGDETLQLAQIENVSYWAEHANRRTLQHGHLSQSMRYYRNRVIDAWADAVLEGNATLAASHADEMRANGNTVWLSRDLNAARDWAKNRMLGEQRGGLIGSGQGRRLAAEGLFVDLKPDIVHWMLEPSTDIRSSCALETIQNQYQIQGLELDVTIVCWDADLRWSDDSWTAHQIKGSKWQQGNLAIARSGYRVLLTRARKEMIIFLPRGDLRGEDVTRESRFYDGTAEFLLRCGVCPLV